MLLTGFKRMGGLSHRLATFLLSCAIPSAQSGVERCGPLSGQQSAHLFLSGLS